MADMFYGILVVDKDMKVFVITYGGTFDFEVGVSCDIYADEVSARKRFEEEKEYILADAKDYFDTDDEYCIDENKDYFDIYKSYEASIWDNWVRFEEKEVL